MKSLTFSRSKSLQSRIWLVALCLTLLLAAGAAAQEAGTDEVMERGRTATDWFYAGELEKVLDMGLTDDMREAMPDLEAWERVQQQVTSQLGDEIEVVDEEVREVQGMQVYLRTVHFAGTGARPV
ncbi:MAG: hypothetical protein ACOC5E_01610, partial [Acidobacteriota bacterium]